MHVSLYKTAHQLSPKAENTKTKSMAVHSKGLGLLLSGNLWCRDLVISLGSTLGWELAQNVQDES